MTTNIFDMLKKDHQDLISNMNAIQTSIEQDNLDRLEDLFQAFKKLFNTHDEAEDKVLYPALKEIPEMRKAILKATQAHHVAQVGILELRVTSFSNEMWGAKFLVIKDSILTHMLEEEEKLFTQASTLLDPAQTQRLGQEVMDLRK